MKYFMSVLSAVIRCGIRRAIKHKDFRPAYDYQSLNWSKFIAHSEFLTCKSRFPGPSPPPSPTLVFLVFTDPNTWEELQTQGLFGLLLFF